MADKHRSLLKYLPLVIIFCAYMYVPLIMSVVEEDRISSSRENRRLFQLPEFPVNIGELEAFPRKLDNYYSDHFGFREELNNFYFTLMSYIDSSSTGKDITQGQDGWLFLGSIRPGYAGYSDPMGDAMNINLYTQEELEVFAAYLSAIKQWLGIRGIEYIYVITPIKHTIYFDKLPDYIEKKNNKSAMDQVVEYLRENTKVTIVDLREALQQERQLRKIYFQTDSHWNSYAANVAQFEIMKHVSELFPGKIKPFKLKPDQFRISHIVGGDLARSANMKEAREESPIPEFNNMCTPTRVTPKENYRDPFTMVCDGEDLSALIFRDSYFNMLEPYFSRQFNHSTYIWDRLTYEPLVTFIEKEKPDIVIDQVVERSLPYMPRGKPFITAAKQEQSNDTGHP